METQEVATRRSGSESMPATLTRSIIITITDDQDAEYARYVKRGKEAAKLGNLTKSIELFNLANEIHSSEKLRSRIKKLEEALKVVALDEDADDDFVDVLNSGLMLYKYLYNKLFPHQREGIAFLYELYRANKKGGLLADDMGLGKTIQIIAFLSGMFDAELIKYVLLVMPTTLISIWEKEFVKWAPGMRVSEFHGTSKNERTKNLEKVQRKGGIVITTYQMLINNWEQISSYNGQEFMWDYMILDEAHKIKTSSTKTSKCAQKIPSKNRILLTGTPVQNNLCEMWSLFDFACKGRLLGTSKTFKMEYENPITRAREKDSTPEEKALGLKISENLMNIIKPYFLRRTKEDIQKNCTAEHKQNHIATTENSHKCNGPEMPSLSRKNDLIVWVYLGEAQEEIYRKFLSLDQIKELLMTTRSPLAELNILKKLCDHPRLLSGHACSQLGLEGQDDKQYNDVEHTGHTGPTNIDHLSDECLIQESGKLVFLMGLLERLQEEGHRTLVFSQSRKMLDIIDRVLKNRGFKVMRIDGTVTHKAEREQRITLFQTNKTYSVFLLTTQVGGVGITLTAADRVVIFDPSWNPATDAQAVDRTYRIGQTENVVIYRLITCGTVEEKIYRRQVFKDSLIRQTTGDKKNPFRYFSKQELKELFSLVDARTSTTQIQLQSLHSAQRKTDASLDDHIAYLHSLDIFGISDHDLMYSHEVSAHEEPDGDEEECNYIQHRVQKTQELVMLESDMHGQIGSGTEEAWIKQPAGGFGTKTKRKSAAEPNNNRKPDIPLPNTVDLTMDEDDVVNVSCRMTLVIEDSDEEMLEESVSKSDVYIAEELQISEKQGNDPNSNVGVVSNTKKASRVISGSEENGSVPSFMDIATDKGRVQIIVSDSEEERHSLAVIGNVDDKKRRFQRIDSDSEEEHPDLAVIDNVIDKKRRFQIIESDSEEEKRLVSSFVDKVTKRRFNRMDSDREDDNVDIPAINNVTNEKQKFKINDSDQENDSICTLIGDGEKVISPFNSPLHSTLNGINASTPKQEGSILELLFPPRRSMGFNTSTASRKSLVRSALDDLDDVDETVPGNEEQEEMEEMDGMAEEEECNEET